ncbi:phosphatase PAP2 family protein [Chryseobacterium carnipullorum]|jgi:membrane-associated phospholipid phosphatase|uniref:Lipid A 1-phosphatase n=8 Tax=Chryseobacterium group TaxID=2782232 RepID=A0A376E8X1_CHRCU|nr:MULTISPECIES: phosphatase PAP2 family protein [Chryseobacterium group]AZA51138.1 phosphatase PAP2 family protein [Chryseobacterium carnipullorum]AZA56781.1 phosphatase PAP2 family protein [Chryseobacterium shandongense]AZA88589.1 phosphatase PAP2 family protein [Chryseobacterium shandongense]AZA97132.1 phosphatase PAP2 family protein [Chryseobacterium shandongense]KFC22318.1 PA-phosphatase [Epilithonimonas lactis]
MWTYVKKNSILILLLKFSLSIYAQDSLSLQKTAQQDSLIIRDDTLDYKKLIVPVSLISAGAIGFTIPEIKKFDYDVRREVNDHTLNNSKLDNYTLFVPAALVYGLNIAGVRGKHNLKDRTIILATSQAILLAIVIPSKSLIGRERPDQSNYMSFPSGHAAIAFSTAQFMFREYRDSNYWISLSGYPFAIFTSVYRIINNKHWVTDVLSGAGIGIFSTEIAYWLYPKIKTLFKSKNEKTLSMISPYFQKSYQQKSLGLNYQLFF